MNILNHHTMLLKHTLRLLTKGAIINAMLFTSGTIWAQNAQIVVGGKIQSNAFTPNSSPLIFESPLGTERTRIDNTTGNFGIGTGTATPTQKLEVAGTIFSSTGGFKFPDGTIQTTAISSDPTFQSIQVSSRIKIGSSLFLEGYNPAGTLNEIYSDNAGDPNVYIQSNPAAATHVVYNNNTILNFNSTGNVGIGILSPGAKLHVAATGGINGLNVTSIGGNGITATVANGGNAVVGSAVTGNGAVFSSVSGAGLLVTSGNAGIGTTAPPSEKLEVAGTIYSTSGGFKFPDGSVQTTAIAASSGWWLSGNSSTIPGTDFIGTTDAQDMVFKTNGQERMRILEGGDHPGNVGIGTDDPQKKLHIVSKHTTCLNCASGTHEGIRLEEQTTYTDVQSPPPNVWDLQPYSSGLFAIRTPGQTPVMLFYPNGSVDMPSTNPQARLKVVGDGIFLGNVGIGKNNPSEKLDITGNVLVSGNVGIGTLTPQTKLDVSGDGYFSGRVAIGTAGLGNLSPPLFPSTHLLAVNGSVIAVEYVAKLSGSWPDFVFNKNHKLKDLEELEKFVQAENHLPGIPTAKEVEKNGISLSEMAKLHMEKIEELTLYMIQMNKEIQSLKADNEKLKAGVRK